MGRPSWSSFRSFSASSCRTDFCVFNTATYISRSVRQDFSASRTWFSSLTCSRKYAGRNFNFFSIKITFISIAMRVFRETAPQWQADDMTTKYHLLFLSLFLSLQNKAKMTSNMANNSPKSYNHYHYRKQNTVHGHITLRFSSRLIYPQIE